MPGSVFWKISGRIQKLLQQRWWLPGLHKVSMQAVPLLLLEYFEEDQSCSAQRPDLFSRYPAHNTGYNGCDGIKVGLCKLRLNDFCNFLRGMGLDVTMPFCSALVKACRMSG